MNFLIRMMHLIHYSVGISLPPPEKERFYALVWLGILAAMIFWVGGICVVLSYAVFTRR